MKKLKLFALLGAMLIASNLWGQSGEMEGPWTWLDMRSGCCDRTQNLAISFNGLNNSHWGTINFWNDGDGIGYTVKGSSSTQSKNGVFSTYYIDQSLPSYTRKRLTWKFKLGSKGTKHYSNTCLYALQSGWQGINALTVDFTEEYNNQSGSNNLLARIRNTSFTKSYTDEYTKTFDFDNRNGSGTATKSWCLLLTHVASSADPMSDLHEWGAFLSTGATWTTYYYKYVSFNGNGSTSGSMGTQTIENSGKLSNNAFSRTGYTFDGWATSSTGGKAYDNQGTITANSGSKGNVTLFARWNANKYTVTLDRKGGTTGSTSVTATYDAAMPAITVPTRTGYTFDGYFDGQNGSGTKYYNANGSSARTWNKASNATLYAKWNINTYTIGYDLQGGTVAKDNPTKYTIETESFTLNNPTRYLWIFTGWTGSNGSTPQEVVTIAKGSTGNKNYTANWVYNTRLANLIDLYNAIGSDVWTGYGAATGVVSYSRGSQPETFGAEFMGGTFKIDLPFDAFTSAEKTENPDGSATYKLVANLPPVTGMETETLYVTMKDGKITDLDSQNAGIEMSKESEVSGWEALQEAMNAGGVIKLAADVTAASNEAALNIPEGKTVVLELNGHIINRALAAPAEDGSVIINNGTLAIMEDGQIKGGNTTGNGGGILNNGNITLYGGKITGNKAKGLGGGIYNNKENTATEGFWMTGGLIADNTAINYPAIGGQVSFNTLVVVQVDAMGKQLSAKTAIAGLKKYDYIQPVMMDPVKFALLAELHEALGDEVWTGYGTATGVISYSRGSEPNEFKAVFMGGTYSVDLPFGDVVSISKVANPDESFTYTMVANVPPATGLETETVQVTIKDGQITGLASENAGIEMVKESDTPLTDWASLRTAMSNGGVIKLTQDYVAGSSDQALVVPAGKTVVLELNGHTINRALNAPAENGSVIINEGTLAIMGDESGKITGGNTTGYGGGIYNAGTLTLYGGEITGNRANAGAGVFNKKENTETEGFWMTGGLIDNNEADTYPAIGGDVYFNTLAVIQIDAEGNTASPAMAIMQLPNLNYIQPVMPADIDELGKPTIMVNYLGGEHGGQYDHEIAELENHDAPVIEGFTFIRWDFVGGLLADGIKLQAIYKSNNENAPAQVTVGDYTLVRPSNNNEYILQ